LLEILKNVCKDWKTPPIVAIDYLQKIPSKFSVVKDGAKFVVDDTISKIKDFQRETNATFFVISTLNRESYDPKDPKIFPKISFKSFKESGSIEYNADVVWGLELCNVKTPKTAPVEWTKNGNKYSEELEIRPIRLRCIKNRQGTQYEVYLDYYPKNDSFISAEITSKDEIIDPDATPN